MKTAAIIASLTRKELRQFEQSVLLHHKRNSLKKLYQCLKKQPTLSKQAIFVKTFGTPYHPDQDHRFRNELRLLNKVLETFLIQLQWKKDQTPDALDFLLLKAYLDRGQYELFEPAWRKLYKKAKQNALYELQAQLLEQYMHYKIQHQELSHTLFEQLFPKTEAALIAQEAYQAERLKQLETLHGFTQQNLYVIRSGQHQRQRYSSVFQQVAALPNNAWLHVLEASVQMYYCSGLAKIKLLQEALDTAATITDFPRYDPILVTKLQSTLALEYFIEQDHEQADAIYTQLLQHPERLVPRNKPGLFFNYLSNLVNLERYQMVIDFYEQHQMVWEQGPIPVYRVHYFLCWAHMGLGHYEAAQEALLFHELQDRPRHEEFYARTLLSMVYHHLGASIMAERETYNLLQNHRYKLSPEETHYKHLCHIHQFYGLMGQVADQKRQQKLEQLLEQSQALFDAQKAAASPLIHRWLHRQIQQVL